MTAPGLGGLGFFLEVVVPVVNPANPGLGVVQEMAQHADASAADVAKALKVQVGLVYQVKASLKGGKKTTKRKPAATMDTGVAKVIAALNLIKLCGSPEQAQQALKAAEKIAKALDRS